MQRFLDRRIVDGALELDIKRSVVGFYASANRNTPFVVSYPDTKLALLVIDQTVWAKHIRFQAKRISSSQNRLHLLSLDDVNRYTVNTAAFGNEYFESFPNLQRLSPQ